MTLILLSLECTYVKVDAIHNQNTYSESNSMRYFNSEGLNLHMKKLYSFSVIISCVGLGNTTSFYATGAWVPMGLHSSAPVIFPLLPRIRWLVAFTGGPMTVPYACTLLEYCLVTGLDWWDLLVSLRPSMMDTVCERFTESFNRQLQHVQQFHYVQFLNIKTSLYRCQSSILIRTLLYMLNFVKHMYSQGNNY
jgi:hypothetical protein